MVDKITYLSMVVYAAAVDSLTMGEAEASALQKFVAKSIQAASLQEDLALVKQAILDYKGGYTDAEITEILEECQYTLERHKTDADRQEFVNAVNAVNCNKNLII